MKKAILLVALAVFGAVPATAQLATSDPVAAIDNIPPAPVTDLRPCWRPEATCGASR